MKYFDLKIIQFSSFIHLPVVFCAVNTVTFANYFTTPNAINVLESHRANKHYKEHH